VPLCHSLWFVPSDRKLFNLNITFQVNACSASGFVCHCVKSLLSMQGKIPVFLPEIRLNLVIRLDAVEDLMDNPTFEEEFLTIVKGLPDLERIVSRIHANNCKEKDFLKILNVRKIQTCLL
jgi:hypothetical protein